MNTTSSRCHLMRRSLAISAMFAVVLAACGSDDDATSSTEAQATEVQTTEAAGDSVSPETDEQGTDADPLPPMPANTDGADVEAARQFILDNLGEPEFVPNGPAFDMSQVDKPVWFVTATEALPVTQIVNQGFEQAAEAAGVEYNLCPGESTADRTALCIQQAIDAGAGSLLIFSIDPEAVAVALEDAQAAGIKVVSGNNATRLGDPPDPNTDFSVSHDYYGTGLHNGAYAVASWGADTNALCITIPEFKVTEAACDGFTDAVAEYCPECEVTTEAVQVAQIVDQVGAVVNTAVLQNSELNFIYGSVDDVATIALPTLERLDVEPGAILVGGQNGTVDALTAIEAGPYMAVSSGQHPFWWGWAFFDATARAQVDGAIAPEAVQTTSNVLFTRESFNPTVDINYENSDEIYSTPGGELYMDGYSSLWTE